MTRTLVVGAGLSGLACARELSKLGDDVLLLESSGRPGGVIRTERREGFLLEWGPNTVRPTPELWRLVGELGLSREAILTDPRTPRYIDFGGRLHPLPLSPAAFLRSRLLSTFGKLRLLSEPFRPRAGEEAESVRAFFARRLGREVAERLVQPFVGGIFAGDAGRIAVSEAFPLLVRFEREHGSLVAGAFASHRARSAGPSVPRGLLTFRDGLETLPRAIARALGERLRTATPVAAVAPEGDAWRVRAGGSSTRAQRIVLAAPADAAASLVEGFAPPAAEALRAIPYSPLAILQLAWPSGAFPRPLRGFGHLVVPQPGRRILGAIWTSSLFADRAPEGETLLSVFLGGARDPEAASFPPERLTAIAAADLSAALGLRGEPRLVADLRHARAIPQYDLGHAQRMRTLSETELRFPGLSFLGNYRGGVSVGDVTRSALETAARIARGSP